MAIGDIERTAPTTVLPEVQKTRRKAVTVDRFKAVEVSDDTSVPDFVRAFEETSGTALGMYESHLQKKIEEDKITQTQRALNNLELSPEATVAGKRAHRIYQTQNRVLQDSAELKELAKTWEGTNEEWQELVAGRRRTIQDDLLEANPEYYKDPVMRSALTNIMLEEAPRVAVARAEGKITQEHEARVKTFKDGLMWRARLSGETANSSIGEYMNNGRVGLQLGRAEANKLLVEAALEQSLIDGREGGTNSLINFTKTFVEKGQTGTLFDRTGLLQNGQEKFEQTEQAYQQENMARSKWGAIQALKSGSFTREEWFEAGGLLNDVTKNQAWTDEQLLREWDKYEGGTGKQQKIASKYMDRYLKQGVIPDPLGPLGAELITKEEADAVTAAADHIYNTLIEEEFNALPKDQQSAQTKREITKRWRAQQGANIAHSGWNNPVWERAFTGLLNIPLDVSEDVEKMPKNMRDVVDLFDSLPPESQISHTDDKSLAFMRNYHTFKDMVNLTENQALQQARDSVLNPRPIDKEELLDQTEKLTGDLADGTLGIPFDDLSPLAQVIADRVASESMRGMVKAGYNDYSHARKILNDSFEQNMTMYTVGSGLTKEKMIMRGKLAVNARAIGINPADMDHAINAYMESALPDLRDQAGDQELTITDVMIDVNPHRGVFIIRDANGTPLTRVQAMGDIGEKYSSIPDFNIKDVPGYRENFGMVN
jgi:hypothetical protein